MHLCFLSLEYPDGSTTVFEYNNSVLTKVTDYTGTGYEISYDGNENDMRVSSVSQFGTLKISHNSTSAKNIIGGGANFEYYAFSSAVEDDVTRIKTVYRFDTCGRTLFSYEDLTDSNINISDITVTNIKDYDVKHDKYNQPTTGKYLSVNAAITGIDAKYPNLLANNSFDSNAVGTLKPSNWSIGSHCANYDGVVAEGYITEEKTHKAYKFNNKCSYSNKTLTQTIELAETALDGNMLIVSAWAKANKPVNNSADSSTAKFELNAILSYDEHENLEKTVKFDYLCTDWQYVAIPMEIPPGIGYVPTKIQVKFDFSGNSGTCLLSNVRVTPVRGMYTNISHGTWTFDDVECKRKVVQYDGLNSTQTYYDEKSDLVRKQEYFTSDSGALNSFVTSYEYDLKHRITKSKDYRNIVTENTYDNNGNLIKQKVYNSADNSVYMVTEAAYDELGNVITAYDPRDKDINTEYCYSESECDLDNLLRNHVDPNNQRYNYGYNESNKLRTSVTAVKSSTISSNIENLFGYTRNSLTQITHNGFNYNFDYDSLGRLSGVEIAGNEVLTRTYTNGKNSTVTTTFGELGTTNVTSDSRGNPTKKTINGVEVASARYDERGNITQLVDNLKNVCYKYYYYGDGNLRKITQCDLEDDTVIDTQTFTYDSAKRPITHTDSATGFEYTTEYEKKGSRVYPDNVPCAVTLSGKYTDRVTRDGLRRVSEKKLTLDSETNALMREQFSYLAGENGNTTEFVSKIEQTVGPYAYDLSYTYDSMGNVSQVRENGTLVAAYTYDSLNQLIAEFNYAKGFKYTYEYDRGGNITTKRRICISDCSLDKEYTYTYASDWKDKLISFDGESIVYDAIGNPTTYRGNQLSWSNVRNLESFGNNTYEYGADGIRTSKTVNGVKHSYTLDDSNIIMETYGSNTIKYFYGSSGITGFSYNGIDYYYRKNLQGDILAIVDASGSVVAQYAYDAWGTVLSVTGTLASTIGAINPFRYRGYYYDTETKLYYLNSRYYDPEVGRFINADDIQYLGENGDFVNYNLFAYCGNNPVMGYDPEGKWDWGRIGKAVAIIAVVVAVVAVTVATAGASSVIGVAIVGATIGAGVEAFDQAVVQNKSFKEVNWGEVGLAAIADGAGAAFSMLSPTLGNFVSNSISCIGGNMFFDKQNSFGDFINGMIGDTIGDGIGELFSKGFKRVTKNLFGGKYSNYSQLQHALREQGHDYAREEVYDIMKKQATQRNYLNAAIDSSSDFMVGIVDVVVRTFLE